MPEWTVKDPSGREIIVTAPEGATEEQVILYAQQQSERLFATPEQEEEEENTSWLYENIGAPLVKGWNQLETTEAVMGGQLGWRSQEEMAELIAKQQRDIADIPINESVQQGLQEIQEAEGWGEAAKAILTNPAAVWDVTVSSLVSSIPALVGFVGGTVGGGAIANVPGALVGAVSGTGIGSYAVEFSQSLVDGMNQQNVDTQDAEAVLKFMQDPEAMAVAREFANKRGVPIAMFDALTAGVAGRLFGPTVKLAAGREAFEAASELGRDAADVARRAALETGAKSATSLEQTAARAALRRTGESLPFTPKVAGASAELLTQMAGGGAGEAAAQIVTEGEIKAPGEVLLEAVAEGPIGGLEASLATLRPRVAPAPRDPADVPSEPAPLPREAYDAPIPTDVDPVVFVQEQAQQFAGDTPITMSAGIPSTNTEDYDVVPFKGTDAAGVEFSGWRVETKTGTPITPVIGNEASAEGARQAFTAGLNDAFRFQEETELDIRANEALGPLDAERNPELFNAARSTDLSTVLPFNDLDQTHQKKVTAWRKKNMDTAPRIADGTVAVEELSGAGIQQRTINRYLSSAVDVATADATVKSIQQLTAARNIKNDDQAFQDFAQRAAGAKSKRNSWKEMGPSQLGALKERLEGMNAIVDGAERASLPVTKRRPFTGPQYNAVVAAARRQGSRENVWKVERNGKAVPRGSRFPSKEKAQAFRAELKDKKGVRVKQYKIKNPLREGEIQKSDVTDVLGGSIGNTDAILDAAVERGDLMKVRGQQRWRLSEFEIREAQPLLPGLRKRLAARLRGAGIDSKKVSLELTESLERGAKGEYAGRVVRLALDKLPENATAEEAQRVLGGTLDHEVIHALFELGVLTEEDRAILGAFVQRAKIPSGTNKGFTYFEAAFATYKNVYTIKDPDGNKNPETGEVRDVPDVVAIAEEAAADAFKDFASGDLKVVGKPRSLFRRIIDFFRGMTSLTPADAAYFNVRFTPFVEGRVPQRGTPRFQPTATQRESDLPESERRPVRYSLENRMDVSPDGQHEYITSPRHYDMSAILARTKRAYGAEGSIRFLRVPKRHTVWQGKTREGGEPFPRFSGGDVIAFAGFDATHDDLISSLGLPEDTERAEVNEPVTRSEVEDDRFWWSPERMMDEGGIRYSLDPVDIDGQQPDGSHPYRVSGRTPKVKNRPVGSEVADEQGLENPVTTDLPVNTDAVLRSKARRKADDHPPVRAAKLFRRIVPNTYLGFRTRARDPEKVIRAMQDHMVENILWLYNQVRPEVRDRAKLWYEGGRALVTRLAEQHDVPDRVVAATIAALSPQKDWYVNVSLAERVLDIHIQHTRGNKRAFLPDEAMKKKVIDLFPKIPKWELDGIMSRTYENQEDSRHKAIWLRTYDEVNNPRGYRKITPEGKWFGEPEGNVSWGSTPETRKAVDAIEDTSKEGIHRILGTKHKIRNFYNNLLAPRSTAGDVTIDTHAVGAALILPVSGNSSEVNHNFGTSNLKKQQPEGWIATTYDGRIGAAGTYGIIADAYREAAAKAGILPREMQSITWEAVRLLFPATWKSNNLNINKVRNVWKQSERGRIKTKEEARNKILEVADGIKDPDWFNTRDRSDDAGQGSSYDGELAELRLRGRRQAGEPVAGTGRTDRGAAEGGVRYSLAPARVAENKRTLRQSYSGFSNVTPLDFVPVKMYNGGVTPLVWDGRRYPVVMLSGHDEWSDSLQKPVGWGLKHSAHHLDDIVKNTNYQSVDDFISGLLNMYHANRIAGPEALKKAGFRINEQHDFKDNIRGKKITINWWYDKWATPGTLSLQIINLQDIFPDNPEFQGKQFASVNTAFALPITVKKRGGRHVSAIRPTPIISPAVSLAAKRAANGAEDIKPRSERPTLSLPDREIKKFALDNPEGLEEADRKDYNEIIGPKNKERKTFGQYILGMFRYNNKFSRPSRIRWHMVDRWEGVRAAEAELKKKFPDLYSNIYADSSAAAMMAMMDRSSGLMQQFLTAGPVMYSRGMFHAINDNIVSSAPPELRSVLRKELNELKARARYEEGDQVKGLMQVFYPLYDIRRYGGFEAFFLYAAARRAERLKTEGREFLMTDEKIARGKAIADKAQYKGTDGKSIIEAVYEDYQKLNNTLILMMQDANLISADAAATWRDNSDYLPFYRELFVDDTREGGLDGQVVYDPPLEDQDEVLKASSDVAGVRNNNLFQNMYNVPAPKELKGGKPAFFIMVNGVRDIKIFDRPDGPLILERIAELKKLDKARYGSGRDGVAKAVIRVKSSTQRIQDPMENILRNAGAAITASMRNVGMLRAIRDLGRLNMATKMTPGSEDNAVIPEQIGVRINGETAWFRTSDRLLLNSMQSTGDLQITGMSIMSTPANILRELVTKTPDFMLANMLRDTISAWATSGANVWPVIGTGVGFAEALTGTGSAALLRASGVFGGYDFKNDPRDAKKALDKYMERGVAGAGSTKDYLTKGWMPSISSPLAPAVKLWQFVDDITVSTDMGTRIAVYNSVLRETGNEAQAAYEALEVINFSRKGQNKVMRFLTATIPFLNARIQGLDVLWRGSPGSADGVTGFNVRDRKRRFIWRMSTLVALTAAYALAHSDDPEEDPHYANATDEKKDMYFILKPEWVGLDPKTTWVPKIPIAFEVGLLTKTIPERIIRTINGTDDAKDLRGAIRRGVVGTLNMNPIPQFLKPLVEAGINTNFYTMSDIVPYYSMADGPEQARAGTGETAIQLAELTGIPAEKIQHVLMQYTGTLGMYALLGVDSVAREMAGKPQAPAMDITQYPFLRRFLQSDLGGGDLQEFYALREMLDSVTTSIAYDENISRDLKSADLKRRENWALVSRKARINYLDKRITDLRGQEARIRADTVMSGEEKKKYLRSIKVLKNEILTGIREYSNQINKELKE